MTEEPMKSNQKYIQKSVKFYPEDFVTIEQLQIEKNLSSYGAVCHYIFNRFKGLSDLDKEKCPYQFGNFCTNETQPQKKLRKTTAEYCQACLQAQKNKALRDEGAKVQQELFVICHVSEKDRSDPFYKWSLISDYIDNLSFEIEELKKPVQSYLDEIANMQAELKKLQSDKCQLERENTIIKQQLEKTKDEILASEHQKLTTLENDNSSLKKQLEKLKHEPVHEKNAWLLQEVKQANEKIAKLEALIEQQTPKLHT